MQLTRSQVSGMKYHVKVYTKNFTDCNEKLFGRKIFYTRDMDIPLQIDYVSRIIILIYARIKFITLMLLKFV